MTRNLLCSTIKVNPPAPEPEGPWVPPPYDPGNVPAMPTSAPWHRSEPCVIESYDGYDQVLHPSVVDFGGKWNGYRWWMIYTPYPSAVEPRVDGMPDTHENPTLAASNDCVTWTPIGDQPLVPRPNPDTGHFNSDNEMAWNPEEKRLELWWRTNYPAEYLYHMHSKDGVNWSTKTVASRPDNGSTSGQIGSWAPCVVRYSDSEWRMWDRHDTPTGNQGYLRRSVSTTGPEGPWSTPVDCTSIDTPSAGSLNIWHAGITRDPETDTLYALAHVLNGNEIHAATSVDGGLSWKWTADPVLYGVDASIWAKPGSMYRPYPVPHENGTHMRVWYTGSSAEGPKIGYAELPLTVWPVIAGIL